jgi:hypothetical protein
MSRILIVDDDPHIGLAGHSSITPSKVVGRNGLRRQRIALTVPVKRYARKIIGVGCILLAPLRGL